MHALELLNQQKNLITSGNDFRIQCLHDREGLSKPRLALSALVYGFNS